MSDVFVSPGWWLASDGKWYPPELHPELAQTSSLAPPKLLTQVDDGHRFVGVPDARTTNWVAHDYWSAHEIYAGTRREPSRVSTIARSTADPRGTFIAVASAALVAMTLFPWYSVGQYRSATSNVVSYLQLGLFNSAYRSWWLLIPLTGALGVLCALVNSRLHAGDRGALAVFIVLRLLVLSQVGLVISAMVLSAPRSPLRAHIVGNVHLLWSCWGALGACAVALLGSLASAERRR